MTFMNNTFKSIITLLLITIISPFKLFSQSARTISGPIDSDTTLTAAPGSWQVTGNIEVLGGATLTIEAGTVINFSPETQIMVRHDGCLKIAGTTKNRVKLSPLPETTDSWSGITFDETVQDNEINYTDMEYGDHLSQMILVDHAKCTIDGATWTQTNKTVIEAEHPYLIIKKSTFPNVDEVEPVHGEGLENDEYFILEGNTFGAPLGYNDVIDFSDCKRPGPILQVYNNQFFGGSDDGLDLDGCDAHIEGNYFANFHKGHSGSSTSNAIATGYRFERISEITVVRNVFYNCDHGILLKEDCYLTAENNTFVNCTHAALNFSEWPDRDVSPGKGAFLAGNIFRNNSSIFENQFSQPGNPDPEIIVNYSILPNEFHNLGIENLAEDPLFVNDENDFHLRPESPAIGKGPNGLDMGAYVPAGVSISGEPDSVTQQTSAQLTIGGPGIMHYQFSVNSPDGPWSEEFPLNENPVISLNDLKDGQTYVVYVRGKNSAGVLQTNPEYAASKTWTVKVSPNAIDNEIQHMNISEVTLYQNSPNPFNASTKILFYLSKAQYLEIQIFDIGGRLVDSLYAGYTNQGHYEFIWNAQNFATGLYFVHLKSNSFSKVKKILLLK